MRAALRRFDDLLARAEATLAALLLVAMIVAASAQALFRNLSNAGIEWANRALTNVDWIDALLQVGTLWLAFLGASLAAHADRHIAIDVLPRIAPPRARAFMRGAALSGAGVTCFFLAAVFLATVLNLGAVRSLDFEVLDGSVPVHLCDASAAAIDASGLRRPALFCAIRSALAAVGLPIETPMPVFQLVAPVGFVVVGLRLLARGVDRLWAAAMNDVHEGTPTLGGHGA